MNILLIVALLAAGCSVTLAVKWPEKDGKPCACNRLHDPVCASDGQDYPNADCARNCGKVRSFVRGYCHAPALCGCPRNIAKVCARRPDGTLDDFVNRCVAECQNGATFVSDGPCPAKPVQPLPDLFVEQLRELRSMGEERVKKQEGSCACPAIYSPVCGLKNRIWRDYASQCSADCAGVERTKPGTCTKACVCGRNYRPVCARTPDGTLKDFANGCLAQCENAETVNSGTCLAKPDNSLPRRIKKASEPIQYTRICTMDYQPVCAEKDGVKRLYSNRCVAVSSGATNIEDGNCEGPALLPIFRDDSDHVAIQLPWLEEDSNDSADSDLVAAQLPHFPSLFKRRALH